MRSKMIRKLSVLCTCAVLCMMVLYTDVITASAEVLEAPEYETYEGTGDREEKVETAIPVKGYVGPEPEAAVPEVPGEPGKEGPSGGTGSGSGGGSGTGTKSSPRTQDGTSFELLMLLMLMSALLYILIRQERNPDKTAAGI